MVMRVSESMKYSTMIDNLYKVQSSYNELMEKMASGKSLNRPSDDPLGMSRVLDYRESKASIEQYRENIDSSKGWLTMTESVLSSVNDLLINAKEIAISQSTATASAETRSIAVVSVEQLIDEMLSLANSQYGDRYLFSGTKTSSDAPFSAAEVPATIGTPAAASGNTFDGTVAAGGGPYTGAVNKTYVVKIVTGGNFAAAEYQVSDDGGATWGVVRNDLDTGTITLGDGIDFTFTAGTVDLAIDDIFHVDANVEGYYKGNGEELSVAIGKNIHFDYSIPGQSVFTDQGDGAVDIFKTLNDLKNALEANDPDAISSQMNNLDDGIQQVNKYIAQCGTRTNRLEIAETNLSDLDYKLTELISNTEDVDLAEIVTKFSMKEVVLKASYQMASSIGNLSIIDFLR
ncbi:MAG: flagellar hook-associated protein FlgL [Deltaproteobacteria bacterium]|nr:flagellar hook-associated protein FlgL [Deltaproteobacteria bacterium]